MSNYNSNSDVVRQTQTAINAAGYTPPLVVDGKYGPNTRAGVVWFQGQHGLSQDGIIGDQTVAATIAAPAGSPNTAPMAAPFRMPPPGVDPLAALQAQLSQLKALVPPVAGLRAGPLVLRGLASATSQGIAVAPTPPVAQAVAAVTTPVAPGGITLPALLGTAVGAALGACVSLPVGAIIGAAGGLVAGLAYGKHAQAVTVHGDATFGFDLDDLDFDDGLMIVAGEIGVPAPMHTLKE